MKNDFHFDRAAQLVGMLALAIGTSVSISSCWFNSAGYIFDQASYKAKSNIADLKPGAAVYQKDGSYYVELPRYKTGKGPQMMYGMGAKEKNEERYQLSGTQMFRIPNYYADYLIGKGSSTNSLVLTPVGDSVRSNYDTKYSVVHQPASTETSYTYSSPYAPLLYTAGALEALCVDLPLSIACSTVGVTGFAVASVGVAAHNNRRDSKKYLNAEMRQILRSRSIDEKINLVKRAFCIQFMTTVNDPSVSLEEKATAVDLLAFGIEEVIRRRAVSDELLFECMSICLSIDEATCDNCGQLFTETYERVRENEGNKCTRLGDALDHMIYAVSFF